MQEIFENISTEVREIADIAWRLAMTQRNPAEAAKFLNNVINYYDALMKQEEVEFLRFYFNMKMEMIKE